MAQENVTQQITDHPILTYKGKAIKRYLQRVNNMPFGNDPDAGVISATIHIQHFGVEADNSETYLGVAHAADMPAMCPDIKTSMNADNNNMVVVGAPDSNGIPTITRVQKDATTGLYPIGAEPEYDTWFNSLPSLPAGVTLPILIKSQALLFANRGDFDNY